MCKIPCFLIVILLAASCSKDLALVSPELPGPVTDGFFHAGSAGISYYGRWDFSDPKSPAADLGAVYIRAAFEGPDISIVLEDNGNCYQYSIDGGNFSVFQGSGCVKYVLASGLDDGPHEVLFIKRSSSTFGQTKIRGFWLKPGKQLLAPPVPKPRKVEFLGDSLILGYGNEGDNSTVFTGIGIENGYMAFGPQAAALLDADFSVIAESAIGIIQNSGLYFNDKSFHMIDLYRSILRFGAASWDFSACQPPDAVVIAAGANDFLGFNVDATQEQYETAYAGLLSFIREKNPSAHIFIMLYYGGVCAEYTRNVAEDMMDSDTAIHIIDTINPSPWLSAPVYFINDGKHPLVSGHTIIAEKLAAEIAAVMGW